MKSNARLLKKDLQHEVESDILKYYDDEYIDTITQIIQDAILHEKQEVAYNIDAIFYPSGHVMGAASVLLDIQNGKNSKRVFHTGDIRFEKQFFTSAATPPDTHIDTIITETTNGSDFEPEPLSSIRKRLAQAINKSVSNNGSVLLPTFSTGKTQEVLTLIWAMMRRGQIPRMPIYTGGMSIPISKVFDRNCYSEWAARPGFELRDIPLTKIGRREFSPKDVLKEPSITIVTNGMVKEGSLSYKIALEFLRGKNNLIGFMGYQDDREPGYQLLHSIKGEKFKFGTREEKRLCEIGDFRLTSHAEPAKLIDFIKKAKPSKVFLVHGDEPAMENFADKLYDAVPGLSITIPKTAKFYDLFAE
jgi:putative mRNA 3-end processing factor